MFHSLLTTEILAFQCKNAEHLTQGRWITQGRITKQTPRYTRWGLTGKIVLYRWSLCQPAIPDVQDLHVNLHGSNTGLVTNLPSAGTLCLWVEVFSVLHSLVIYDFGGVEYTWLWIGYLQTPLAIKETLRHFLESRHVLFSLHLFVMMVRNPSLMRTILTLQVTGLPTAYCGWWLLQRTQWQSRSQ